MASIKSSGLLVLTPIIRHSGRMIMGPPAGRSFDDVDIRIQPLFNSLISPTSEVVVRSPHKCHPTAKAAALPKKACHTIWAPIKNQANKALLEDLGLFPNPLGIPSPPPTNKARQLSCGQKKAAELNGDDDYGPKPDTGMHSIPACLSIIQVQLTSNGPESENSATSDASIQDQNTSGKCAEPRNHANGDSSPTVDDISNSNNDGDNGEDVIDQEEAQIKAQHAKEDEALA
ncbi:hypothetical protein BS47DRAFT_1369730 [Hydnum rufescens UP504]|uniref:Uncharacterized protein n=1 Tax=Hydnum rufescens UP504 TaxID=1448309 RepID=A0A9P6DER6_9AGAM|nr:hypothetical protein BS47DRAFT_1369730 [Hydnum rufescens UP504]